MDIFLAFVLLFQITITLTLIFILSSYAVSTIYGAPYIPVKKRLVKNFLAFGELSESDIFYDLGSGDGRTIFAAIEKFGVKKAVGYEIAPWPYLKSRFALYRFKLNGNIKIYRGNFLKNNLSPATFIYLYLYPKILNKAAAKLAAEIQVGAKILSITFPVDAKQNPQFKLLKNGKIGGFNVYLYSLDKLRT